MRQRLRWEIASRIPNRRRLIFFGRILLSVAILWALKRLAHDLHLDVLRVDAPFIALILSTLVLLGVLLQGVLGDYKESERLPAEAATILEFLSLEMEAMDGGDSPAEIAAGQAAIVALTEGLLDWLLVRISTDQLHVLYRNCYRQITAKALQLRDQPILQSRWSQKMETLLGIINRINAIRETSFVSSVYWLALIGTGLMCTGLVFTQLNSPLQSTVFMLVVSFVLLFLIRLIADLDNPFGYDEESSAEDVSLDPLLQCLQRLQLASSTSASSDR